MKISLRTKFYLYLLPLFVIFPVVIYSLISPYTQLRAGFAQFEIDATRAQEAESFAGSLSSEQLELFHFLGASPAASYDITTNANYNDFESAVAVSDNQFQKIQSEVDGTVAPNDEERVAVDGIGEYYGNFKDLVNQVVALSAAGNKQEALDLLGEQGDDLVDDYLRPDVEELEVIKEDDVKTSLLGLTDTLTRQGVIPIPGLSDQINSVITHFENSVDTQKIGQSIDDLQGEVFYQVVEENTPGNSVSVDAAKDVDIQEVEDGASSTIAQLRSGLSTINDQAELVLVANVDSAYQNLVVLDNQALTLSANGQGSQALDLLQGSIDNFAEGALDPLTSQLVTSNQQDVQTLIAALNEHLITITYWLYALGVVIFLLGLLSLWRLSRDIITPIVALRNATTRLAAGDFNAQVAIARNDELGELAATFNGMAGKLHDVYAHLQEKVKEQTAELSKRVDELESTKKATLNLLEDINTAKAKDEAILGGIGDALVVTDARGVIVLVNHVFEEMLGWIAADVQGKLLTEVAPVQDEQGKIIPHDERVIVRVLTTGKGEKLSTNTPYYYLRKNGSRLPVAITVTPIVESGVVGGAVEIFRDVTHEKEIDQAKTEFVSLASHQLRTPLSAIGWYSEMLMAGDAGPMTDDQKNYLKEIHDGNTRMVDLVNSLLNVSRLELGTFAVEPVPTDLVAVAESVLSELAPQIALKHEHLEKKLENGLPQIPVDPKLFRMIIQNLASNAVKYTPDGGNIEIAIEKKDPDILLTVRDNGYGIPKNQQDKIFGKLFRADNIRKYETEGTGLGLYIVKSILDQTGGSVRFESEEGKGTTFFATIPLSGMRSKEGARKLS